jgi:hypothetical protein
MKNVNRSVQKAYFYEGPHDTLPKIALLTSFIKSPMWSKEQFEEKIVFLKDHLINKACYCKMWSYDCLLNQTQELTLLAHDVDSVVTKKHMERNKNAQKKHRAHPWWLKFGCWDRVAHLQAALPNYDWVLYGDMDYIVKDMSRPIESFIQELHQNGKTEAHVIVPSDFNDDDPRPEGFSSFAVLVRNSPFGRKVLENWRKFALGICPNGNFESADQSYQWYHSDQPGLWYALIKTHMDFHPNNASLPEIATCNKTTGYIDNFPNYNFEFRQYFTANGLKRGNYGMDLDRIMDDQQIIFSRSGEDTMSGLGVDHNWAWSEEMEASRKIWKHAFAYHQNAPSEKWDSAMKRTLNVCKEVYNCTAGVTSDEKLEFGCGGNSSGSTLLQVLT